MRSRERLIRTLNHEETDNVVVDLGSTPVSGIAASTLARLRQALGFEDAPVIVHEPFQILGLVEDDLRRALDIDVASIMPNSTFFGYRNEGFKRWMLQDGTPVLVGAGFVTTVDEEGNTYLHPRGDINAKPSAKMPKGGYYFDNIVRQKPVDESSLNGREDFKDDFSIYSDEELKYIEEHITYLYNNTDYGLVGDIFVASLGDVAFLPGPDNKDPRGIRDIADWLVAHKLHPNYIKDVYELHTEVAIKNLELYRQAVGDKIQAIAISGADFGTQRGEFISVDMYREFYKPFHKKVNDWVHKNTLWKTFYHSCGSIVNLLDDFIDAGVDIINPVQTSAFGMDPKFLKDKYGERLVFWGGGVDTQRTLPFGTPEEVRKEVIERLDIFTKGGGYVFATIHNIQPNTPVDNILAIFDAIREYNDS